MRSKRSGKNKSIKTIHILIIGISVLGFIQVLVTFGMKEKVVMNEIDKKNLEEESLKCSDLKQENKEEDEKKENNKIEEKEDDKSIFSSTLKEDNIKYYAQDDPRYGNNLYTNSRKNDSTQTIETSGCGPSAYSIVVSTLNNIDISPPEVCEYSLEIGTRTDSSGTDKSFFIKAATDPNKTNYNLNYEIVKCIDRVKALLEDGKHLIIANMAPGHVTEQGHYIVLAGYKAVNGENYFKVYDPHSINEYYIYDGSIIDTVKDDGFILLSEKVVRKECQGYYAFSNKNQSVVIKLNKDSKDEI